MPSAPIAASAPSSSKLALVLAAAASRRTSSTWCTLRHYGLHDVAAYWQSVVELNSWQQHRIAQLVVQKLFRTVTGAHRCPWFCLQSGHQRHLRSACIRTARTS